MISVMDREAKMNENAPAEFQGLDRFEARKKILAEMEALDLLLKVEPCVHAVPHDEKSKSVILEPMLTDQWYCDAVTLAKPAIKAVEEGRTEFVPANWTKTYFEWMRNIQPWCISRQLWWGHQIPAWYGPDGHYFVAETEDDAKAEAKKHYGHEIELTRDPDVLDTWFSSALWPFSTLGWPDKTDEVKRYYPADTLITGFDIIFFWVARMMMMGMHFMGDVPFRKVYIHALVRDEKGQKMSKSKGNVVDPLDIIDQYGADALRFTMAALAAQGRDVKWSQSRCEGYRNFATKLWNAARYCEMNEAKRDFAFDLSAVSHTLNKWILSELKQTIDTADHALAQFKYNEAASALYQFVWGTFCDWYVEFTKPLLNGADQGVKHETRQTMAFVLDHILSVLNPFMPYLTEELAQNIHGFNAEKKENWLITASWPDLSPTIINSQAENEMNWVVRLIQTIRSVRADMNVPASAQLELVIKGLSTQNQNRLATHGEIIKRLARLSAITCDETAVIKGALQTVLDEATLILPVADVIDIGAERERLRKEIKKEQDHIAQITKKLSSPQFVERAPADIVEEQRERMQQAEALIEKLQLALKQIEAA
jgi:valyl-tRNA synthetase